MARGDACRQSQHDAVSLPLKVKASGITGFEIPVPGGYTNALAVDDGELERAPNPARRQARGRSRVRPFDLLRWLS